MERSEADKYSEVWKHGAYRQVAPGEHHVEQFLRLAKPQGFHSICDFGCGTGRAARNIALLSGSAVCAVDFADNCLDRGVFEGCGKPVRFVRHDLTSPLTETFDFGLCTDVMEHLPEKDVGLVLYNITKSAKKVYFAISTQPDHMGKLIGETLHLTVKDPFWWHDRLQEIGFRVDWSAYNDDLVMFYGSAYANGQDFAEISRLNVEEETIRANIRSNLELGLNEIAPHEVQKDQVIYLLAGGPSLADFEAQIVEAGKAGQPIVTTNGAYNWLLDRGIKPAAQVMVDARGFNKRFVTPLVDTCKYLMSSQVSNDVLKELPAEQTWLWHSGDSNLVKEVLDEWSESHGNREWWPVHGGTTVVTRALVLLAMLGFRKIEVFGWDSCIKEGKHHAYEQPENDSKNVIELSVGNRQFKCHGWMVVQANEFARLVRYVLGQIPDFEMAVHGDGLIAHMLQTSSEMGNGS